MSARSEQVVSCYYCGSPIAAEKPGRLDMCSQCGRYLHVCRMCVHFDPSETSKQCAEDDAEKVQDKQAANFCDYFSFRRSAFDADAITADAKARARLSALFRDGVTQPPGEQSDPTDELLKNADALFRK